MSRQSPVEASTPESQRSEGGIDADIVKRLDRIEERISRSGFFNRYSGIFVFGLAVALGSLSILLAKVTSEKQGVQLSLADYISDTWFIPVVIGIGLSIVGIVLMLRRRRN